MSKVIICPKCRGRKTVFDPSSLMLTIGLPLALMMEWNEGPDKNSLTKQRCPTCDGEGWLFPPDRE